jgi:hypothetical protein
MFKHIFGLLIFSIFASNCESSEAYIKNNCFVYSKNETTKKNRSFYLYKGAKVNSEKLSAYSTIHKVTYLSEIYNVSFSGYVDKKYLSNEISGLKSIEMEYKKRIKGINEKTHYLVGNGIYFIPAGSIKEQASYRHASAMIKSVFPKLVKVKLISHGEDKSLVGYADGMINARGYVSSKEVVLISDFHKKMVEQKIEEEEKKELNRIREDEKRKKGAEELKKKLISKRKEQLEKEDESKNVINIKLINSWLNDEFKMNRDFKTIPRYFYKTLSYGKSKGTSKYKKFGKDYIGECIYDFKKKKIVFYVVFYHEVFEGQQSTSNNLIITIFSVPEISDKAEAIVKSIRSNQTSIRVKFFNRELKILKYKEIPKPFKSYASYKFYYLETELSKIDYVVK